MTGLISQRRFPHGRAVALFGGSRLIVSDSFSRTDSATTLGSAETGQAWSALKGTWGVNGNRAYNPSATAFALAAVDAGVADATVGVTIAATATETALYARIVDVNNWIWLRQATGGVLTIEKMVAGVRSSVATVATHTLVSGDVLGLKLSGTSVTALLNGAQIGDPQTVTNFTTATKYGIGNGAGSVSQRWDDFRVTVP